MNVLALPPYHNHNALYAPEGTTEEQWELLSNGLLLANRQTEVLTYRARKKMRDRRIVNVVESYQELVHELRCTGPISREELWKGLESWINMVETTNLDKQIAFFERERKPSLKEISTNPTAMEVKFLY